MWLRWSFYKVAKALWSIYYQKYSDRNTKAELFLIEFNHKERKQTVN